MLPEASQARKAIWEAINPHTGKRRIDEAFPLETRLNTRENEMMIKLRVGSTWQVVGSDNYNSLVGSPPVGVVFSEFSIANPASWAYIRPILRENKGWALFIYTPRGRNHGESLYRGAKGDPTWFAQMLMAPETGVFTPEELQQELSELQREHGMELGQAFFDQEYMCSFDSAVLGAIYAGTLRHLDSLGRIGEVPYDLKLPVHTAWDLGFDDSTAIWFWQITYGEIRLIDYYQNNNQAIVHYCDLVKKKPYTYGRHWVPHDAANKLQAAAGHSILNQMWDANIKASIMPATSQQNSIEATRATLERCWFDAKKCELGLNALRSYQFEWDDDKRTFKSKPRHDWASHGADAFEIIAQVWRDPAIERVTPKPRFLHETTADEIFWPKVKDPFKRERL
jgi:hypothetical protein